MVSKLNKASNGKAFLALFISVFCLILGIDFRCTCGHCSDALLDDARECRCCKEILECMAKFTNDGKDAECIAQHWDYNIITHRTVLDTALGDLLSDKSGKKYRKPTSRTQDG